MAEPVLTFDEARELVRAAAEPTWRPELGTLHVHHIGWDFGDYWRMNVGPREAIVDGDPEYAILDAPVFLVGKDTGHVSVVPWTEDPLNGDSSSWTVVTVSPGPPPAQQ